MARRWSEADIIEIKEAAKNSSQAQVARERGVQRPEINRLVNDKLYKKSPSNRQASPNISGGSSALVPAKAKSARQSIAQPVCHDLNPEIVEDINKKLEEIVQSNLNMTKELKNLRDEINDEMMNLREILTNVIDCLSESGEEDVGDGGASD